MAVSVKHRQVQALPGVLEHGAIYFVDLGGGLCEVHVTNGEGIISTRQVVGLPPDGTPGQYPTPDGIGGYTWTDPPYAPVLRDVTFQAAALAVNAARTLDVPNSHAPAELRKVVTSHAVDVAVWATAVDRELDLVRWTNTPNAAPTAGAAPVLHYRTAAGTLALAGRRDGLNALTLYAAVANRSAGAANITVTLTLEDL